MFVERRVGGPEALRLPGRALASTHRRRSLEGRPVARPYTPGRVASASRDRRE